MWWWNGSGGDTIFKTCFVFLCPVHKELKESATELLFGGHETTASAATSLIAFLGLHHDVLQKVRKELQVKVCVSPRAISQERAVGRYLQERCPRQGSPRPRWCPSFKGW